jgi:YD repeat-containing protein
VQSTASYSRSADAGADASPAGNPLGLLSETETAIVNGRTTTTTWTASPNAFVTTLNSGRQSTTTLDATGFHVAEYRPFETPSGNFTQAPTSFPSYDGHGRLSKVTRGTRATNYTYDLDTPGYLSKVVVSDSSPSDLGFSQETDFSHDGAGRITAIKFPDGNQVAMAYDPSGNGNVTAITPPGGAETDAGVNTTTKTHSFAYDGIGLLSTYAPPSVSGDGSGSTSYTWDGDRHLTNIARPDGTQVSWTYDAWTPSSSKYEQLRTITFPNGIGTTVSASTGTTMVNYYAVPTLDVGKIQTLVGSNGETLSYTYDGPTLLQTAWSGVVAGLVNHTYTSDFLISTESVVAGGAGTSVSYGYADPDGWLTSAGALTISLVPATGQLSGTTLGASGQGVSDSYTYDTESF